MTCPWLASIRVLWKKILPVQVEYIVFTLNTCARRATARWLRCAALRVSAVRCAPEHADRTCGPLRTAFGADPVQACWSRPEQWCGPSPQTDRIRCGPTQSRAGSKPCSRTPLPLVCAHCAPLEESAVQMTRRLHAPHIIAATGTAIGSVRRARHPWPASPSGMRARHYHGPSPNAARISATAPCGNLRSCDLLE